MVGRWGVCPRGWALVDALAQAHNMLGFEAATDGDEKSRAWVLTRIIESTSRLESLRVLEEVGIARSRRRRSGEACPRSPKPAWWHRRGPLPDELHCTLEQIQRRLGAHYLSQVASRSSAATAYR